MSSFDAASLKAATKIHSPVADLLIWDTIILRVHPQFLLMVDSVFYLSQELICWFGFSWTTPA